MILMIIVYWPKWAGRMIMVLLYFHLTVGSMVLVRIFGALLIFFLRKAIILCQALIVYI